MVIMSNQTLLWILLMDLYWIAFSQNNCPTDLLTYNLLQVVIGKKVERI